MNKKKKLGLPIIIGIIVVVAVIFILIVISKSSKNKKIINVQKTQSISKISELIPNDYQSIDCIDDCKYFYGYKGEDKFIGNFAFFDEAGKKIGEFDLSKVDSKLAKTFDIEDIAANYFIASYLVNSDFDYKYVAYNMKGNLLLEASKIEKLTDKYFLVKNVDKNDLVDSSGKVIYRNIDNVKVYNDKYITFKVNKVDKIIDENAMEILSGYTISKVILDQNDEIDYLIIKNTKESIYNYYSIKDNRKKGDSFTSYTIDKDKVIITKKDGVKNKPYVLNSNGAQAEYIDVKEDVDTDAYFELIKEKVDTQKYSIFKFVLNSENQKYILVNNVDENKYGVLDISKGEFKELGIYKENSDYHLNLKKISKNGGIDENNDIIYSIECTNYYCDNNITSIYNFTKNELLITRDDSIESPIYSYKLYDNGYYVIGTSASKFEDSNKYFLYDNNDEKLFNSNNDIKIIDSKLAYYMGNFSDTGKINLYSLKDKKVINLNSDDETISVSSQKFGDNKLYQFVNSDNTYLINDDGNVIKLEGIYKSHDDIGIYLASNNKISYYNVFTRELSTYELGKNESTNGSTGNELIPYRNAIFINNSFDNNFKVIGVNDKILIEKKDLQIHSVLKRKDGSILIIVIDKDGNKGIYIAK